MDNNDNVAEFPTHEEMSARAVYYRVVEIARIFVTSDMDSPLTVRDLKDINPSVAELARHVKRISAIIQALASAGDFSDENMAINARQCSTDLYRLAVAVNEEDQEKVDQILVELDKYQNCPY